MDYKPNVPSNVRIYAPYSSAQIHNVIQVEMPRDQLKQDEAETRAVRGKPPKVWNDKRIE
jgi:hypothetical protein